MGSVLGVFYAYASRQNGKLTRAVLTDSEEKTRHMLMDSDEKTRQVLMDSDGKTRELIRQGHDLIGAMHEDNKRFHEENKAILTTLVELLRKNGSRS